LPLLVNFENEPSPEIKKFFNLKYGQIVEEIHWDMALSVSNFFIIRIMFFGIYLYPASVIGESRVP
jgi:hypothetical protein